MKTCNSHFVIIAAIFLSCFAGHAASFLDYRSGPVVFEKGIYLLPNENYPHLALPIWRQSEGDIYVSVGTDRAFIGAAASNATHLLALDFNPGAVAYNRIMIEMLKIADDGADLRHMRTDFAYLKQKFGQAKELGANMDFDFVENTFKDPFWSILINPIVRKSDYALASPEDHPDKNPEAFILHWMWRKDDRHPEVIYWKNPKLFGKMQTMAREGRIQAELFNLKDSSCLQKLAFSFRKANLQIAVFDFSNTQNETYLGPQGIDGVILALSPALRPKTILLFSWFDILDHIDHQEYTAFLAKNYSISIFKDVSEAKKRLLLSVSDHGCPDPNSSAY